MYVISDDCTTLSDDSVYRGVAASADDRGNSNVYAPYLSLTASDSFSSSSSSTVNNRRRAPPAYDASSNPPRTTTQPDRPSHFSDQYSRVSTTRHRNIDGRQQETQTPAYYDLPETFDADDYSRPAPGHRGVRTSFSSPTFTLPSTPPPPPPASVDSRRRPPPAYVTVSPVRPAHFEDHYTTSIRTAEEEETSPRYGRVHQNHVANGDSETGVQATTTTASESRDNDDVDDDSDDSDDVTDITTPHRTYLPVVSFVFRRHFHFHFQASLYSHRLVG